ncbi:aminoglycoside N(3)-acetyltransferase [Streptacidiphilus sp. EB129]|uniref:aminoglycoside N(3)-acetyltransferase n=1 Tax=Streptacidiphilus sp. EB129 TaxID=3156262 RepID=UPI0035190CFC
MRREVATGAGLLDDLLRLGVRPGGVLFVQSSLRALGPVAGGAATVLDALRGALGPDGTVVGYASTPENSDTSRDFLAATAGMGPAELRRYRDAMPGFDPARTPCSPTMGRLSEQIRTSPGALRSAHPQTSFTALGPLADKVVSGHPLECHLGEDSPLGRLYELGAQALLLGIPDWLFTGYHLAEYRVPWRATRRYSCVVADEHGERHWVSFRDLDLDDRHFPALGAAVRATTAFGAGRVGAAEAFLLPVAEAVDAAIRCLPGLLHTPYT